MPHRDPGSVRAAGLALALLLVGVLAQLGGSGIARAAVAIDCPPPASPASATPAAAPGPTDAAFPEGGGELAVFAAASLTDAFGAMKQAIEAQHPGVTITYNFAGSQALVTQLSEGAHADVLAAASAAQMAKAQEAGVIEGPGTVFTQNRLAIVVPKDNPANIQAPADLAKPGVKLVLAQAEVPVGRYARQSICAAGADAATYGEGFVAAVGANVVSEEDNVKAVLTKVRLGEADAGIVYTTDVTPDVAPDVTLVAIPPAVNVVARYPIAPIKGGHMELANAFIAFVLGSEGQAILSAYGFEPKP